jgi:predicted amidohydrolase YtcJ
VPILDCVNILGPPSGGGKTLGEAGKITSQQALDLFAVNAARHTGNRSKTGRIETGMLDDLPLLARNPFKIPVTQIHETKVKMTCINGETVYQAPLAF